MTREYKLYIDWDNDNFICRGVQPSDALNIIRGALHKDGAFCAFEPAYIEATVPNSSATRHYGEHDSGLLTYRGFRSDGVNGNITGVIFGAETSNVSVTPTGIQYIPVAANQTYTLRVWVRVGEIGSETLRLRIWKQDATIIHNSLPTVTRGVWTALSVTFNSGSGTTHIAVGVGCLSTVGDIELRGWMLVSGASMPTAFNAGDISNAYDDISAYVRDNLAFEDGLSWNDDFCLPARLVTTLDNRSGLFNPNNESSPLFGKLRRGLWLALDVIHNGVTIPLWRGTLARLTFYGEGGNDPHVVLEAEDATLMLADTEYIPRYRENARVDEALLDVFESGALIYPNPSAFGILDAEGYSELSRAAVLYENRITDFARADTTLPYAGDNLDRGEGVSAQTYLREILACEAGGRLFWDAPRGKYVFHNRLRGAEEAPPLRYSDTVRSIRPSALLAYWMLTETSGTAASDSSGNGRHGTYSGGVALANRAFLDGSMAAYFDGVDDYVDIFSAIGGALNRSKGTLSAWVYIDASEMASANVRPIFWLSANDAGTIAISAQKPASANTLRGTWRSETRDGTQAGGAWIHVAITWKTETVGTRFHVNGLMYGTNYASGGTSMDALTRARIGATLSNFWKGNIAHVALWSEQLTYEEIYKLARQSEWVQPRAAIPEWQPGAPLDNPPPDWAWGDDVINHVDLYYETRKLGSPASVVYTHDSVPINLPAFSPGTDVGATRTISARYSGGGTEQQIAVKNGIQPVAGVDYSANYADGAMENANSAIFVGAEFGANVATIRIVNWAARPVTINSLQLRGTPVITSKAQQVFSRRPVSIAENGLHRLSLNIRSISSVDFAQQVADARAAMQSDPIKALKGAAWHADTSSASEDAILGARVGDLFTVDFGDGAKDYLVLARNHQIALDGNAHIVWYTLKAHVRSSVIILDSPIRGLLDYGVLGL